MIKPDLILGTAEFSSWGYGGKPPIDEKEIFRILNLAWEGGIKTLDTADSYNCYTVLPKWTGHFSQICKTKDLHKIHDEYGALFYHYGHEEKPIRGIRRASVYTAEQMVDLEAVIIPFNINNTELAETSIPRVLFRSVFDRGRLLEHGYTVKECLDFAKRNDPKGIIVGVNSVKELEEILRVY